MTKTSQDTKPQTKAAAAPSAIVNNTILKLVLPKTETTREYQKALKKAASYVKAPGFRAGKTPLTIVEEKVGQDKLINQALEQLLPSAYTQLIKKEAKKPLTQPQISIVSAKVGEDWEVEIQIAEKPELKLGKYQELIKKAHLDAVKEIAKQEEELKRVEKTEKVDNQAKKAEPKTLSDSQKEDLTLKTIFQKLVDQIKPQIPELLIKEDVYRQLDELNYQLKQYRLEFNDFLEKRNLTFEQLTAQMAGVSLAALQVEFILDEIIQDQKLTVSDQDYSEYLTKIESEKKLADLDEHMKEHLSHTILRRKVVDFVLGLK